jgi:hypothetical protein
MSPCASKPEATHKFRSVKPLGYLAIFLLPVICGCGWLDQFKTVTADNPVMGPPPPRMAMSNDPLRGDDDSSGTESIYAAAQPADPMNTDRDVLPSNYSNQSDEAAGTVAATVNGYPIFTEEVLAPYSRGLATFKEKYSERDYVREREKLIRKVIKGHIENRLLISSLESELKRPLKR